MLGKETIEIKMRNSYSLLSLGVLEIMQLLPN